MATFIGTSADETITNITVSPTVMVTPSGSLPSDDADVINGGGGNDALNGAGGDDTVAGADGNDRVDGDEGDDILYGGVGNDTLLGGRGNDQLIGGPGADALSGGLGNDEADYLDSSAGIAIDLTAGTGVGGDASGDTFFQIENLVGSNQGDSLIGDSSANKLLAAGGDDFIEGRDGGDSLNGGAGNDTVSYQHSPAGVTVSLLSGIGSGGDAQGDTLDGFEVLIGSELADNLSGSNDKNALEGRSGNDVLHGLGDNDTLTGGDGNDTLDGGSSSDTMIGGPGDDTYMVDDVGDIVDEGGGVGGTDTVISTITYDLVKDPLGALENLNLAGAANINGSGNLGSNIIQGNAGNNVLDGRPGADMMRGLAGNDTYVVDNAGDVVDEAAGSGSDTVQSSIGFSLADGAHAKGNIENLTLTGSAAINGTGNALANVITGNAAANILDGQGGNDTLDGRGGADVMRGRSGDDTYVVDNAGDVADESVAGSGAADLVRSSVSFNLLDSVHSKGVIERLTLTGSAAINGAGNAAANTLLGNASANVLAGNLGNDFLTGSAGRDRFLFDTKPNKLTNVDHITDMDQTADFVELDHTIFSKIKIGTGHLKKSAFFAHDGAHKAHDGTDRIVYDKVSGDLYYDKDGAGGHHAKLFAILDGSPDHITAKDFLIVA